MFSNVHKFFRDPFPFHQKPKATRLCTAKSAPTERRRHKHFSRSVFSNFHRKHSNFVNLNEAWRYSELIKQQTGRKPDALSAPSSHRGLQARERLWSENENLTPWKLLGKPRRRVGSRAMIRKRKRAADGRARGTFREWPSRERSVHWEKGEKLRTLGFCLDLSFIWTPVFCYFATDSIAWQQVKATQLFVESRR